MADPLLNYQKPGFPVIQYTQQGLSTTIEYIGDYATLETNLPEVGAEYGDYLGEVKTAEIEPVPGTDLGELKVSVDFVYELDPNTPGVAIAISYEIEWVMFARSLYEHPAFAIGQGGSFSLDATDIVDIEKWENEPDPALKILYRYVDKKQDPPYKELTNNAQKFALGIQLGQTEWEDYSPVVRRTTTYMNGLPDASSVAGLKDEPPVVAGMPEGLEWRKSCDRFVTGSSKRKWDREEEWVGAVKVLSDRENIFW